MRYTVEFEVQSDLASDAMAEKIHQIAFGNITNLEIEEMRSYTLSIQIQDLLGRNIGSTDEN